MQHKTGTDRNQIQFMSLNDWVSEDNPVRVIDAFAGSLSLQELGFTHAVLKSARLMPITDAEVVFIWLQRRGQSTLIRKTGSKVQKKYRTDMADRRFKTQPCNNCSIQKSACQGIERSI